MTGRREKSIDRSDRNAIKTPAQDDRHVVRVGKSRAAANISVDIRGQIVFGKRQGRRRRVVGSTKQRPLAYPGECIEVQEQVVLTFDRERVAVVVFRLVARIVEKLTGIGETRGRSDAGIYSAHPEWINAAILRMRRG